MIWVGVVWTSIVIGLGFAFFAAVTNSSGQNQPAWIGLLFWGLFLWWQVFPIFIAGFGSNFEFARLLRFPLSLRAFYLLGLGYGLSDFAAISSICWVFCMIAGAAFARIGIVPVMLLVSVLFVLINVTLERLVGSWLEKLLAKRRARELFFGIFVLCMVSLNFLNPVFQRWGNGMKPKFMEWIPYLSWLPGSLAGNTIGSAVGSDLRGFAAGFAGLLVWGVVTSTLLWRRFAAQYAGEEISESAAPAVVARRQTKWAVAAERPGWISPPVAAMVMKEFRYLTRNGFAFLTLLLPPIMVVFFSFQFGPGSVLKQHSLKPGLFFPGMMAYLILILLSPAYNSFAYEGRGIQTYFMAPVRFRDVLLGKNLFLMGLVGFELAVFLGAADVACRLARHFHVRGHRDGGSVRRAGTIGDRELVVTQLSEKNGNREDEGTEKLRRGGVDRVRSADRARRRLHAGVIRRPMDRKSVAAVHYVCGIIGRCAGWIFSVPECDEWPGRTKEGIADRDVNPRDSSVMM